MLFPGNLTLQHAGMTTSTLQGLGAAQGLSLQLQAKTTLDPKTSGGQNIQAINSANKVFLYCFVFYYIRALYKVKMVIPYFLKN